MCYPETQYALSPSHGFPLPYSTGIHRNISTYLSQPSIQQKLGVDRYPGKPQNVTECNEDMLARFGAHLNHAFPTWYYIEQLLERDVRVLVYAGDVDFACNWVSLQLRYSYVMQKLTHVCLFAGV